MAEDRNQVLTEMVFEKVGQNRVIGNMELEALIAIPVFIHDFLCMQFLSSNICLARFWPLIKILGIDSSLWRKSYLLYSLKIKGKSELTELKARDASCPKGKKMVMLYRE